MAYYSFTNKPFRAENCFIFADDYYDIGIPIIKWYDKNGFDGYYDKAITITKENNKTGKINNKTIKGKRYSKRGQKLQTQINRITQLLVHHSGADRSDPSVMYNVLWKQRGLSVQFAGEDDGRLYQFTDAIEKCWHAGKANKCSIGIEACLFPLYNRNPNYYGDDRNVKTKNIPHDNIVDEIHGKKMKVFCFTKPQLDAIARLYAGLWLTLYFKKTGYKKLYEQPPMFPRKPLVNKNTDIINPYEPIAKTKIKRPEKWIGLIGHFHWTKRKIDPAGFDFLLFEKLCKKHYIEYTKNFRKI